jgi:hypothetical protein
VTSATTKSTDREAERCTRLERAVAELGEAFYGVSVTATSGIRGKPYITQLIVEYRAWVQAAQSRVSP